MPERPQQILKRVFGYDSFRPMQADIIANVLQKRDTLVIMPTGGGKSLCYQIPALLFDGLTVVVSPLISLMKDQVEQLQALGVPAVYLNSSLSRAEYRRNMSLVSQGKTKLLYVAPEALLTQSVLNLLARQNIECITIDEAHCISEWGHDFRPHYRQLVAVRTHFPDAVIIALTATATPRVRQDIVTTLGFEKSNEFVASFNRPNLFLRVVPKENPRAQLLEFLREYSDRSGIVYCMTRKQVESVAEDVATQRISVRPYHAGLSDEQRRQHQELFIRDDVQVIVATIAFGMGINKPNVRFVVHYDLPKNLESYYQEIGRAGRDGLRSECLLLFGYGDLSRIRFFIDQKAEPERRVANQHLQAMVRYAESPQCRREPLLAYFGETFESDRCGMCDNCLQPKREQQDMTVPAQKFLSCVKRTGELFGVNHIVDVLCGTETEKALRFKHQQLSTFGIGAELNKKQWRQLSHRLLLDGLLRKDETYGSLKLTEKARPLLQNQKKFFTTIKTEKLKRSAAATDSDYDFELFTILRKRRKALAERDNVPPYIVFSDRTLIEMATHFPQSKNSLRRIHGVGEAKLQKYGLPFLKDIMEYCRRNGLEDGFAAARSARRTRY